MWGENADGGVRNNFILFGERGGDKGSALRWLRQTFKLAAVCAYIFYASEIRRWLVGLMSLIFFFPFLSYLV